MKKIDSPTQRAQQAEKTRNSLIPIVIGVSAHRNIRDEFKEQIKLQVKNTLREIHSLCPSSPIIMLNGLASGGDQWCAEAAKELVEEFTSAFNAPSTSPLDLQLKIALPCAETEYLNEHDFTPETMKNYSDLKSFFHASVFTTPDEENMTEEEIKALSLNRRDYLFRQQAIYVATKCHFLLALWNGEATTAENIRTACGTSGAIEFALNHSYRRKPGNEFNFNYDSVAVIITSPRKDDSDDGNSIERYFLTSENNSLNSQVQQSSKNDATTPTATDEKERYCRHDGMPVQMTMVLLRTDRFNRDTLTFAKKIENGSDKLNDYPLIGKCEYDHADKISKKLHDCHSVASTLSTKNKNLWLGYIRLLSLLGGLLLIAFMMFEDMPWKKIAAIVSLSMFAVIAVSYALTRYGGYGKNRKIKKRLNIEPFDAHDRFVEYRALAEALRVQYFLCENAIPSDIGNFFTWSQKTGVAWVKKAVTAMLVGTNACCWENSDYAKSLASENINTTSVVKYATTDARALLEDRLTIAWVGRFTKNAKSGGWDLNKNGQVGYHLKKYSFNKKEIHKNDRTSFVFMMFTLALYLILFLGALIFPNGWDGITLDVVIKNEPLTIGTIIKLTLSSIAVLTFFLSYYYDKQALEQTVAENESMIHFYRIALDWVERIYGERSNYTTDEQKRNALTSLFLELSREEIHENGNWVAYNRYNDVNLPI